MTLLPTELVLHVFSDRAQQVITVARRKAERAGASVLDSRCLLASLATDNDVWPAGTQPAQPDVLRWPTRPFVSSETEGDVMFRGMKLSREVETVLDEAAQMAQVRRERAGSVHLLYCLSNSPGSEASIAMRGITMRQDPWADIRAFLVPRLQPELRAGPQAAVNRASSAARRSPEAYERVVALMYLLLRDEVPFGRLVKHVAELERLGDGYVQFTNTDAEALARSLVDRLWS